MESVAAMVEGLIDTKKITAIKKEEISGFVRALYNPTFLDELTAAK